MSARQRCGAAGRGRQTGSQGAGARAEPRPHARRLQPHAAVPGAHEQHGPGGSSGAPLRPGRGRQLSGGHERRGGAQGADRGGGGGGGRRVQAEQTWAAPTSAPAPPPAQIQYDSSEGGASQVLTDAHGAMRAKYFMVDAFMLDLSLRGAPPRLGPTPLIALQQLWRARCMVAQPIVPRPPPPPTHPHTPVQPAA